MSDSSLLQTALHSEHKKLGAKFAPFAGYDMPIQYTGIIDEHSAVRKAAGLFDVSHMGVATVEGPDAHAFLNHALTRDLSKLTPGKAAYSLLCHPDGGTVDDLIVYCATPTQFFLVLNASNKDKDMAHLQKLAAGRKLTLQGPLPQYSLLALQGPASETLLRACGFEITQGPRPTDATKVLPPVFSFFEARIGEIPVRMATTGYTGETGGEIFVDNKHAVQLWEKLLLAGAALGVKACGLGARDTLRTEMGYSLYGHELSDTINPVEAGLSWAIGFDKPDFVGKSALVAAKAQPQRKLISLQNNSRQAPRAGMRVLNAEGQDVGEITSGTFSPSLGYAVGLALVNANSVGPYSVDVRGNRVAFETTTRPFLKKPKG
ncbi:MAG: glycine cleavage system aminomethyltransferase GcvT [Bdellovibrionales bacterium]|nr:glycine cleavage system aminomethyltransferase GcvT [Bdellovibrionales bacterium]